jgi:hypothetical protein
MRGFVVVVGLLLSTLPAATLADASKGSCATQVPESLLKQLSVDFPSHHVAEPALYDPEDIERRTKEHGGDPCFSVATADVDGDGTLDFALVITDRQTVLVVAARHVGNQAWQITRISDAWPYEKPVRVYVDPLRAGAYEDMYATDEGPSDYVPTPGRVPKFNATHDGFVAGDIEATAVGYFYTSKGWVHLQLGD